MNTLYGLLTWNKTTGADYAYYEKRHDMPLMSSKQLAIRDILLIGVPSDAAAFFASVICDLVRYTNYGAEIQELDANNTYVPVTRPPNTDHSDLRYCFQPLIQPASVYKDLRRYLDDDIDSTMNKESFLDLMAAGCLQLLREGNR